MSKEEQKTFKTKYAVGPVIPDIEMMKSTNARETKKYIETYDSEEVEQYFHNMVAAFMLEYQRLYPDYTIKVNYRFKSPKSLRDKVAEYVINPDKYKIEYNKNLGQCEQIIKEITDAVAMKTVLIRKPDNIIYPRDSKMLGLLSEKNENLQFANKMEEFASQLEEVDDFDMTSSPIYKVTKEEYYKKCIELIDRIISMIPAQSTELIDFYKEKRKTFEESLDAVLDIQTLGIDEELLVDETDYPMPENSEDLDFFGLLKDFSSRIYDDIDFELLNRQVSAILKKSELLKQLGIGFSSEKLKITPNGYRSYFNILQTPIGHLEMQNQTLRAYEDGNHGYSAHASKMGDNKKIKGVKIPNLQDKEGIKKFRKSIRNISPRYYTAEMDVREKGRVIINGSSDYENYKKVISEVPKGSQQAKLIERYLGEVYRKRDALFASGGKANSMGFILPDIKAYIETLQKDNVVDNNIR